MSAKQDRLLAIGEGLDLSASTQQLAAIWHRRLEAAGHNPVIITSVQRRRTIIEVFSVTLQKGRFYGLSAIGPYIATILWTLIVIEVIYWTL